MLKKLFLLLLVIVHFSENSLADDRKAYQVGDTIMEFKLKNIDGKFKALNDYKSEKGIILIFTCNHCPFSVAYEDRIIALHKKYSGLGFPVVAINPNDDKAYPLDSYENMIERAQEKGFTFDYLHDETQEVAKTFGATNTPHVFIVSNQQSHFKVEYIGAIDDNSYEPQSVKHRHVENAVDQLVKKIPITVTKTKALGCSIKWKK
ncbi:MAG: thioredoxin family protein [Bacteroidetes bacterium]|nr:thioredoxin family protein [Bacteroidota bacterium]MBK8329992.1 thioredoxin family protein [Bacteroidota bacterium]